MVREKEEAEVRERGGRQEAESDGEDEEVKKPVNKNKRYRRDKPWDDENIDHWKVSLPDPSFLPFR